VKFNPNNCIPYHLYPFYAFQELIKNTVKYFNYLCIILLSYYQLNIENKS